MATNTGLFEIPENGGEPGKVTGKLNTPNGEGAVSEALVAKFTGPDELIASGHPERRLRAADRARPDQVK